MKKFLTIIPFLLILLAPPAMMYQLWGNPVSAGEDDIIYYYPLRVMTGQAFADGKFPMENPLEATGGTLLADPQTSAMHPATWLFAVLPANPSYTISIFIAYWLAGFGTFVYLRRLGMAPAAATFGAIAFMFSGFMIGHRVHLSMILTVAMLPWGLWCVELLRGRRGWKSDAGGTAFPSCAAQAGKPVPPVRPRLLFGFGAMVMVVFLAFAAGNWPTLIQMMMVWFAYLCLRGRPFWRTLAIVAVAVILAMAMMGPQIMATADALSQATRQKIGFSTAGENSYFPPSAVMALFPMLLGNRNPNFFSQPWWGPWHQCETLGYVGLITLVLAMAAVWKFYRKPADGLADPFRDERMNSPVRVWTWLGIGLCVWMLGYYIPPLFKVIHMIPVLGVVRCPSRMLMAVDMGLATLAAAGIHAAIYSARQARARAEQVRLDKSPQRQRQLLLGINDDEKCAYWPATLVKTYRKIATIILPLGMAATLGLVALTAWYVGSWEFWQFFRSNPDASAREMAHRSVSIFNPAVWVQLALAACTIAAVWTWSARPARRAAILTVVLLADLFFIVHFVDMPSSGKIAPNPANSPAAEWLKANAPADKPYRVYGLSSDYFVRSAELLLPKTCQTLGVATIANYGPFQTPAHAQLLGFDNAGINRDWAGLLRRNYLLSNYNVRYIVAADKEFRDVLDSVVMQRRTAPDGPEMLGGNWKLTRAQQNGNTMTFRAPWMWQPSEATGPVAIKPNQVYRISLEARGPDSGAANYIRAEVTDVFPDKDFPNMEWDQKGMSVRANEIGTDWRRFQWQFRTPKKLKPDTSFRLTTQSERPIEVRNVSLRTSEYDGPFDTTGRLADGEHVYVPAIGPKDSPGILPAINATDPSVVIYENRLCRTAPEPTRRPVATDQQIGQLRWASGYQPNAEATEGPDLAFHSNVAPAKALLTTTVPAAGAYILILLIAAFAGRRRASEN